MNNEIDKIVIVGGGSAGWMVASTLIKFFPEKDITLVASESIPTVGVGESTLSDLNAWLYLLNIKPSDFLSEVDGTFKMGIGFTDFYNKDSGTIFYPFGRPDTAASLFGLTDWHIRKAQDDSIDSTDYVNTHFPLMSLINSNKMLSENTEEFFPAVKSRDIGYQVDASKFGWYLRTKYAMPKGVKFMDNVVTKVNVGEDGISSIYLDNGNNISADLFIDCSGFKSLLLGEALNAEFVSTKHRLPNNKAWASPVAYTDKEKELELFTNCTAIENGWVWNTPLWSRIGSGYVYSDEFVDDDTALQEFKSYLDSKKMKVYNPKRSKDMEFRQVHIRNGYYKKTWIKNTVAIGLSSGFLEPLESTGLWFVHQNAINIVDILKRKYVTQFDKDLYNTRTNKDYKIMMDFVALHYAFSNRADTPYWKSISSKVFSEEMMENLPNGIDPDGFAGFSQSFNMGRGYTGYGITSVAVGLGYHLFEKHNLDRNIFYDQKDFAEDLSNSFSYMDARKEKWKHAAKFQPTHYQYLKENHYNEI